MNLHDMQLALSPYGVLHLLSISFTDKTPLRDLFSKAKINNVKGQVDALIPEFFD